MFIFLTTVKLLKIITTFRGGGVRGGCDPMYLRWVNNLDSHAGLTTITYRSGVSHLNADALSRFNPGQRKHEVIYGPARGDCGFKQCIQCQT